MPHLLPKDTMPNCIQRVLYFSIRGPPESPYKIYNTPNSAIFRTKMNCQLTNINYLTGIHPSIREAGADKVVVNFLEVGPVAVFIAPDWYLCLPLAVGFLATVVGCAPANNCASTSRKTFSGRCKAWLRQTQRNNVFGFAHRPIQD